MRILKSHTLLLLAEDAHLGLKFVFMVDLLRVLVLKGHSAGVLLLLPDRRTQAVKLTRITEKVLGTIEQLDGAYEAVF